MSVRCPVPRFLLASLALIVLTSSVLGVNPARPENLPRLFVCPRNNPEDLASWPRVLNSLYAYKFYIDRLDPAENPDLPALVRTLVAHDVKIAVEMAGLVDWPPCDGNKAGQSFAVEQPKLQQLLDMGGRVDILVFDGPVSRTVAGGRPGGCEMGMGAVIRELVEVYDLYRDWLPEAQIGLLVNFPNWAYGDWPAYNGDYDPTNYGDYREVLATVLAALDTVGDSLAFVEVDSPYGYSTGTHQPAAGSTIDPTEYDWLARLRELEAQIEAHPGTEMCMIYNSEIGGFSSNQLFHEESLALAELYPLSGGSPEQVMFQSWYEFPTETAPEDVDFTFLNIPWVWLGSYPTATPDNPAVAAILSDCKGYPNPFNPGVEISFRLSEAGPVSVRVFDTRGRHVATLCNRVFPAGEHSLDWNGVDDAGREQAGGLYLFRIEAGGDAVSVKMLMLK